MADPTIPNTRKQTDPELSDLLDLHKKNIFLSLNCHAIATIQSFDSESQIVSATINYTKTSFQRGSDGNYSPVQTNYPILLDVPVIVLSGGNSNLTFPITKGDTCLILFNDRDIDNWFQTGQLKPVASTRTHSFSDGIALVGLNSLATSLVNYDLNRAVLKKGNALVGVGMNNELVKIANETTTLNTLLQSLIVDINILITAVAAITVSGVSTGVGVSGPPVNAAAITAVSATLTTLATSIAGLLE